MRGKGYMMWLAWRLLWPARSVLRLVTIICVLGVACGTMLQIVVRGVMDGMVAEIDAGVQACVPPLLVQGVGDAPEFLQCIQGVKHCTPVSMGYGVVQGAACRYATWGDLADIESFLHEGSIMQLPDDALVSKVFARKLGLRVGDSVRLQLPGGDMRAFRVSGIVRVPGQMLVPDLFCKGTLPGEQLLAVVPAVGYHAESLLPQIQARYATAQVVDASGGSEGWLQMIARVKRVMGIILFMTTLLAAFAAGGLLLVICLTHRRLMAVMYAFGASRTGLLLLFMGQGAIVATLGAFLGVLLGALVLHYRMQVQAFLRHCGLDAFPTDVLDMQLPALAPPALYITQAFIAWATVLLASLPGAWQATRCRSLR